MEIVEVKREITRQDEDTLGAEDDSRREAARLMRY